MNTYRIYATQNITYAMNIEASSKEEAEKIAEKSEYFNWEEVDYQDWEVRPDWTE